MILLEVPAKPAVRRGKGWSALQKKHLKVQPQCQCCGRIDALDVHHIIPVVVDRTHELEPSNLITLCRATKKNKTFCHFTQGHLGIDWKHYDYDIVNRAQRFKEALAYLKRI